MSTPNEQAVRNAALDLALGTTTQPPTSQAIAAQSGLSVADVQAVVTTDTFYSFVFRPMVEAIDRHLRTLPIHQHPTLDQQRDVLNGLIDGCLETPREVAFALLLLSDRDNQPHAPKSDAFVYQSGVRLLGTDYDTNPDQMTRVYLAFELAAISVVSRRHDLTDPHTRDLVLDSLVGVLHPPSSQGPVPPTQRRRWADRPETEPPSRDG